MKKLQNQERNLARTRHAQMQKLEKMQEKARNFYTPPDVYVCLMKEMETGGIHNPVIVACCGSSGVGKSSWVNAILGKSEDPVAKVGTCGECTTQLNFFEHHPPECPGVAFVFVDCPGGGT